MRAFGLALLAWSATACAAPVEAPIDQALLRGHIATLASDAFEGRGPGTKGERLTVDYIVNQYKAAGLAPGAADGGWIQPVALVKRVPGSQQVRWHGAQPAPELMRFIGRGPATTIVGAPVVFAGYGLDLGAADLRGKAVLILSGRPEGKPDAPGLDARREALARRGAAVVIALNGARDNWASAQARFGEGRIVPATQLMAQAEGVMAHADWTGLIDASLVSEAEAATFQPVSLPLTLDLALRTDVQRFRSANVIGKVPGTTRPDEAALFMAHWDHLGFCRPKGAPDRICNGAVDNASGVALLIEVARRLAQGPRPGRSLYFVATTGEESGLLGARALATAPPVALSKIAGAINLDTVAVMPAGAPVATIGRGLTPLDPLIDAAAMAQGRAIDADDEANVLIRRQDGWALKEKGVAAVMVGGAFADMPRLEAFLSGTYHGANDDMAHLPTLEGMAEDGALQVVLARMIADPEKFPLAR